VELNTLFTLLALFGGLEKDIGLSVAGKKMCYWHRVIWKAWNSLQKMASMPLLFPRSAQGSTDFQNSCCHNRCWAEFDLLGWAPSAKEGYLLLLQRGRHGELSTGTGPTDVERACLRIQHLDVKMFKSERSCVIWTGADVATSGSATCGGLGSHGPR